MFQSDTYFIPPLLTLQNEPGTGVRRGPRQLKQTTHSDADVHGVLDEAYVLVVEQAHV